MLPNGKNPLDARHLDHDAKKRSDLTAWLDRFISYMLRHWEKSLSKSAYEDSLSVGIQSS